MSVTLLELQDALTPSTIETICRYFKGDYETQTELADEMGISVSTVNNRLRKGDREDVLNHVGRGIYELSVELETLERMKDVEIESDEIVRRLDILEYDPSKPLETFQDDSYQVFSTYLNDLMELVEEYGARKIYRVAEMIEDGSPFSEMEIEIGTDDVREITAELEERGFLEVDKNSPSGYEFVREFSRTELYKDNEISNETSNSPTKRTNFNGGKEGKSRRSARSSSDTRASEELIELGEEILPGEMEDLTERGLAEENGHSNEGDRLVDEELDVEVEQNQDADFMQNENA